MSRRTFPRAAAAGLLTAALGTPAAAQAPNPWRGETAAPAPPTRQITVGIHSGPAGLTFNVSLRHLTALPVAPAPREVSTCCADAGPVVAPAPRPIPTRAVASAEATPLPRPRSYEHDPVYSKPAPTPQPPRVLTAFTDTAPQTIVVRPAGYTGPVVLTAVPYMPPPAPLPGMRLPPASGEVIIPAGYAVPVGVRPVVTTVGTATPVEKWRVVEPGRVTPIPPARP